MRFKGAEERVREHEGALADRDTRPSGEAAVDLRHDARQGLVAHQGPS